LRQFITGSIRALAPRFTRVLVIGIGGSALGDVCGRCSENRHGPLRVDFIDNTDLTALRERCNSWPAAR
jgi:glucose-6-phosphate isomerase